MTEGSHNWCNCAEATDKWQKERRATTDAYTQAGLLMTCAMCFQDDCLPHEMFACERHHGKRCSMRASCCNYCGCYALPDAHSIDQAMCAQVLEGVEKPADLEERIHEPNDHVICLQCLRSHCEVQCEQGQPHKVLLFEKYLNEHLRIFRC